MRQSVPCRDLVSTCRIYANATLVQKLAANRRGIGWDVHLRSPNWETYKVFAEPRCCLRVARRIAIVDYAPAFFRTWAIGGLFGGSKGLLNDPRCLLIAEALTILLEVHSKSDFEP
jgi:hypothetical protein